MKIKLLLDEDVHLVLAQALRKRGYDVIHVQELERKGKPDIEQFNYAISGERCLVSFNVKDFVLIHNQFIRNKQKHFGIVVSKQLPVGEALRKLLKLLQQFSGEIMKNRLEFLS